MMGGGRASWLPRTNEDARSVTSQGQGEQFDVIILENMRFKKEMVEKSKCLNSRPSQYIKYI